MIFTNSCEKSIALDKKRGGGFKAGAAPVYFDEGVGKMAHK